MITDKRKKELAHIKSDFISFSIEAGKTVEQIHAETLACDFDASDITGIYIGESDIDGMGVFSSVEFGAGDDICMANTDTHKTLVGRYTNHSPISNAEFNYDHTGACHLVAIKPIAKDEEIVADYRHHIITTDEDKIKAIERKVIALSDGVNIDIPEADIAAGELLFSFEHTSLLTIEERVLAAEYFMENQPQVDIPVKHDFLDGIYRREITFPAGTMATGRVHPTSHFDIMMTGEMAVPSIDGFEILKAPMSFTSIPYQKKAGLALSDVTWVTFHPTSCTTVEDVEKEIFADKLNLLEAL